MKSICNRIDRDRIFQFEDGGGGESEQSNKDKIIRYQWEFQDILKSQTYRLYAKKKKEEEEIGFGEKRKNFILKA